MKDQFPLRISLALVFCMTFVFNYPSVLTAQDISTKRSSVTWNLGFGTGSYNGLVPVEINSIIGMVPGRAKFTNWATAFRLVVATDLLRSRLSLGGEYGAQVVIEGEDSPYLIGVVGPDGMIHSLLFTGDYLVGNIGKNTPVYATGGVGMLLFAYMETRATDPFGPDTKGGVTIQPAASLGIIVPVRVAPFLVIDPQIRFMGSTGKEKLLQAQFMIGLSYRW